VGAPSGSFGRNTTTGARPAGLLKSAVLSRASGARRVIGFSRAALREASAGVFYTESVAPECGCALIHKNLALVRALGIEPGPLRFPLDAPLDDAIAAALPSADASGARRFAILNPGAGWPNKTVEPRSFRRRRRPPAGAPRIAVAGSLGTRRAVAGRSGVRESGGAARFARPPGSAT